MPRQDNDIAEKVYKVIHRFDYDRGGSTELRLVAWIINGKEKPVVLERRDKWVDDSGVEKPGKAKGLSAQDIWHLLENLTEIGKIMGIPAEKLAKFGIANEAAQAAGVPVDSAPWK